MTTVANTGRFQYTGQTAIPQIGLYYYKARFYNPALGRFMQTDPIGYEDDNNLYAYVGSDPLNRVDPTGLCTGSHITREDGTCAGTGAFTTQGFRDPRPKSRASTATVNTAATSIAPNERILLAQAVPPLFLLGEQGPVLDPLVRPVAEAVKPDGALQKPVPIDQYLKDSSNFYKNLRPEIRQPGPENGLARPPLNPDVSGLGLAGRLLKAIEEIMNFFNNSAGSGGSVAAPQIAPTAPAVCPDPRTCIA